MCTSSAEYSLIGGPKIINFVDILNSKSCLLFRYGETIASSYKITWYCFAGAYSICESGWTPSIDDICLKVSSTTDTWHGAKCTCKSLGGDLVTLERKAKEYFVRGWLAAKGKNVTTYIFGCTNLHTF